MGNINEMPFHFDNFGSKIIYIGDTLVQANKINGYLLDADNIIIDNIDFSSLCCKLYLYRANF